MFFENDRLIQENIMPSSCIVCESKEIKTIFRNLSQCRHCTFVFANTDLSENEINKLYIDPSYFFGGFEGSNYVNYVKEQPALYKNFKSRLREVLYYSGTSQKQSLFEIGSAYGFFLNIAKSEFQEVMGTDISSAACHYASETLGLNVQNSDFINIDFSDKTFDNFCIWDTIEHLAKPQLYLEKISLHTKKNGFLHLTTGDINSVNAKIRGSKWRLIHPPTHLHYFSKKTITKLLKKYHFEIINIHYCGQYRTLNSLLKTILTEKNKKNTLYKKIDELKLLSTPIYLNLFDIMHVVAKKT